MTPTRVPGILVVYHRPDRRLTWRRFADAATVREHIHSFRRWSRFPVWEVNTDLGFPDGLRRAHPTVILLHYSMFGSGQYRLGEEMTAFLRGADALKVAFFQDEHYFCGKRFAFVNEIGVDLVYTHVRPADIPRVWGRYTPRAGAVFNYPGYVADEMLAAARRFALPAGRRDLDVGYRGRPLPPLMGSGALEKLIVGERFKELAASTRLRVDIDTTEEGRLYGDDWYRLLGRSRAVLGVESGTSYIDLEDEVRHDFERRQAEGRPVTLEALLEGPLGRWDGNIRYRTISPRHLEAAAFRNVQVLLEGEYSGVLEPMVHYIPLRKDFDNFDEVVRLLEDRAACAEIADNAHRDLIASGRFSYETFVRGVDAELIAAGVSPSITPSQRRLMTRALRAGGAQRRARTEAAYALVAAEGAILPRLPDRWRALLRFFARRPPLPR